MPKTRINSLWVCLLIILAAACSDHSPVVYSSFVAVPADGWDTLDGREFHLLKNDSVRARGLYDVVLAIRHDSSYPYRDLWLEVEQSDMSGIISTDTIRIPIAGKDGSFIGTGRYGLYEQADTILREVQQRFGWQLSVRHIMAGPDLKGINNLGIILLKR